MSWFTAGEIVVWLVLAAGLGVALGWLLHETWSRRSVGAVEPVVVRLVKGKQSSMILHAPGSPADERTRADVWFETEDESAAAGFRAPKNR